MHPSALYEALCLQLHQQSKQPPQCGGENLESEGKVRVQGNYGLSDGLYTKLLVMVVVRAEAIRKRASVSISPKLK